MATNFAPLLADLFLYSYEAEFIQKLLYEKKKSLAVAITVDHLFFASILFRVYTVRCLFANTIIRENAVKNN